MLLSCSHPFTPRPPAYSKTMHYIFANAVVEPRRVPVVEAHYCLNDNSMGCQWIFNRIRGRRESSIMKGRSLQTQREVRASQGKVLLLCSQLNTAFLFHSRLPLLYLPTRVNLVFRRCWPSPLSILFPSHNDQAHVEPATNHILLSMPS